MKERCKNPKNDRYYLYGELGIGVCESWENSFESFLQDMGPKPAENYQIDRINPEKGYYKENCRWVTPQQNSHNTRGCKNASSKYKGVSFVKERNKWAAQLTYNGKRVLMKRFNTEVEAAKAYNEAAEKYFGEYAYLNKI